MSRAGPSWTRPPSWSRCEEIGSAILLPARLAHGATGQQPFSVAHLDDPVGGNSPRHQVVSYRPGPPLAEPLVVRHRAPLVSAAVDRDRDTGVGPQPLRVSIEDPRVGGSDPGAVEIEVHR